jgi:multidrug efflux system outer membrane protein
VRRLVAAVALATGCACTMGPDYKRPPVVVPDQFYAARAAADSNSLADVPWWELFHDEALQALIAEALEKGYDTRIAAARVEEARAQYGIAGSALYPQLSYDAKVERSKSSAYSVQGDVTGTAITANVVSATWELDLWGKLRRLNEAARAEYLASEEARRGVLLSLISDLASDYFALRELDAELEIAHRSRDAFADTAQLFQRRFEHGAASGLETARAEADLATVSAQVPLLEQAIVAQENALNLLVGRVPGPVPRGDAIQAQNLPPEVPSGLPSTLLLRRPDLREAEQHLVASNAAIGAVKASLFPTISLTGAFGGVSPDLSSLFNAGKTWSIAAGLVGPLFQGGRLHQQQRLVRARFEQSKLLYEQAVTRSFGEVSTALAAVAKLGEAEADHARAVAADQEAVRLANLRYVSGLSPYFEVLDAMERLLVAEINLSRTRRDRLHALVQLYRALGGGWQTQPPEANP